ncbi:hypothetical protein ACFL5J_02760, partial [Thermodesulfobacteriota bacterium]
MAAAHCRLRKQVGLEVPFCILALGIAPHTPRFFLGEPQPLREILFSLVESSLLHRDVDIINVRLASIGNGLHGCHRLEIMVASNGTALPPKQLTLFDTSPQPQPLQNAYAARQNNHKIN